MQLLANLKNLHIPTSVEEVWAATSEGAKAIKTAQRAHIAERKGMLQQVEVLHAELKADTPGLEKERAAAQAEAAKADAAHRQAQLRFHQATVAKIAFTSSVDVKIAGIEARLRADADPDLAEFVSEVRGTWDKERGSWGTAHAGDPESAGQRIAELSDLQEQAEALQLEVDPAVATAELERLKADLAGAPA